MPSKSAAAATLLSALALTSGFQLPSTQHAIAPTHRTMASHLSMSGESEVEKLRAAAAQAREEYERLSGKKLSDSGKPETPAGPVVKDLSVSEVRGIAESMNFGSGDAATQSKALDDLVDSGDFSLWNSAVRRGPTAASSSMSKLVPFPVTLQTLENRSDGKITGPSLGIGGDGDVSFEDFQDLTIAVVLGSTALGIASLALLPDNVGATFTYLFALIPIVFIGIGSTSPGIIAAAIVGSRGDSEDAEQKRERICRHEAGHFLCGYLCGLPVKSYDINPDTSVACVEFHSSGSPSGQELPDDEIAALSVVAMSGSVAEIMAYDKATGGENDLLELQNCFRRSKEFIGAAKQQDLTRWGALTSYSLIKSNLKQYEGLVQAFKEKKSLSECVSIIEGTA